MNTGPIAHRYAKALLKLVQETAAGDIVYPQACVLVHRMQEIPQLEGVVHKHPEVDLSRKLQLLEIALGEPMSDALKRFVTLVYENGRIEYLLRMIYSFIEQYRAANSIKVGRLVTASPAPGLKDALQRILQDKTGATVILEESVDESIIGGFILQLDDQKMDASVETQFRRLRSELIDNNNRIV